MSGSRASHLHNMTVEHSGILSNQQITKKMTKVNEALIHEAIKI